MKTKRNLSRLCVNKNQPESNINNIKEMMLKSGIAFFNLHHLHRMEKDYFTTSLIKFQVDELKLKTYI